MVLFTNNIACRPIPTLLTLFLTFAILLFPDSVLAVCPVCTVAATAGLGISRYLGIDDFVTSLWIGGLIISSSMWLVNYFKATRFNYKYNILIFSIIFYFLTILPLYFMQYQMSKIIKGSLAGSIVFILAVYLDNYLRYRNNNKVYFYYQKVILPITGLAVTSVISFLLF